MRAVGKTLPAGRVRDRHVGTRQIWLIVAALPFLFKKLPWCNSKPASRVEMRRPPDL
jgi:hypothetical protein